MKLQCFKLAIEYVIRSAFPSFSLFFLSLFPSLSPSCQGRMNFKAIQRENDLLPKSRDHREIHHEVTPGTISPPCCDHVTRSCWGLLGSLATTQPPRDLYPILLHVRSRTKGKPTWRTLGIAKIWKVGVSYLSDRRRMKNVERIFSILIWTTHRDEENGKVCRL